tara:strand:+ start:1710 stop:1997 length:288 start_codon:yes stop_codon:yes gene_type:complete
MNNTQLNTGTDMTHSQINKIIMAVVVFVLLVLIIDIGTSEAGTTINDSIRRDIVNDLHIVEKHGLVCAVYKNRHKGTGGLSCNWDAYNKRGDEDE